ncbi:DUF3299 domain-containing protein [Pseudobacter ginsenosidimutans]|jgi:hypothetical protein|uniref:DUF3299 domain-containing protein n=1 Tax=Pseudobacter ginsenosidimutans TaxID=661488 RepID=A0A4Q7N1J0_9BACT|nr:DUF3299 domain-containing protein [Pseudobacter ginsenosidimutans]QEC43089.1 DUF3299 domain-containing protein [Pseudobacter ginsenosidimutans]RZS74444.1 hypothetical protein EV199_0292 [Pseudobacter ginsenosidimutans]
MNKIRHFVIYTSLLLLVACTNIASLCRHDFSNETGFTYRDSPSSPERLQQSISINYLPAAMQGKVISWQMLKDVSFKSKWNEEFQLDFMYPVFGENVKKLKGQKHRISGYMVPLNIKEGLYAVSRYTYAACYFCGKSGPESVVSLKFTKKPRRFKLDEYVTVSGTMDLNDKDVNDFIYIFRNAEEVR